MGWMYGTPTFGTSYGWDEDALVISMIGRAQVFRARFIAVNRVCKQDERTRGVAQ